jgi:hypothetical protein
MCNGWNHTSGCECGFGPPYDRDVPDYFDEHVGAEGGRDLSDAGPRSARLGRLLSDNLLTTQLVSTFLWQSYIGQPSNRWLRGTIKSETLRAPIIYIVRHGRGYPRHDLLVFDPHLPADKVEQGYVDVRPSDLRGGWRNFQEAYAITERSVPRWLSELSLQDIPEIANEAMAAQRHYFIAMHPPRIVWTLGSGQSKPRIASPAMPVSIKVQGKNLSTAGVISEDDKGRKGVTTALHALRKNSSKVFVMGFPGQIRQRDRVTDSCFIEMTQAQLPATGTCAGPLSGMTPGKGENVWFDGVASGRRTTHVDGWTPELPWFIEGIQSRIITPAVTDGGDSGAALVNKNGLIIGFALYRTGFNSKSPHSAWVWGESVFSALHLQ